MMCLVPIYFLSAFFFLFELNCVLQVLQVLKVLYHKKHIFSALYIYKLVLPEPANSLNEENKRVLHGLCSPPTGNTALLQAVQILLLSLHNERTHYHRLASTAR